MPPSIKYEHGKLNLTVTEWAKHKKIKRSAMSNRVSRWKRGEITIEKCFGDDTSTQNAGNWGDLHNDERSETLQDISNPTTIDDILASDNQLKRNQ